MSKTVWITGASSGIGREFARRYARLGFRLILTARRTDRLEALAAELTAKHSTFCRILPALWIRIYGDPQRDLYRVGRFFRQHLYDERCGGGIRDHTNGSCVCLGRFNCDI